MLEEVLTNIRNAVTQILTNQIF